MNVIRKKQKNKRGFTLIEVLTVIAVLAVVALITIPIVTNMIEKSRREAFSDSVVNGMKSVQSELAANDFETFPSVGVDANSDKTGLEKNPFISGIYKKPDVDKDIYAFKVTDGRYCATGYKTDLEVVLGPCYLLDKTPPVVGLIAGTLTSRSIQVIANSSDEESDIVSYEFSKDNGATWTTAQKSNSYNFDMLTKNTSFNIKVRVTNENSLVTEKSITLKTNNIDVPTYTSNPALTTWSKSKVVTITYPTRQTYFIYEYSTNGGSSWSTLASGTTQNVTFNANGTLIARVRDGYNTVTASTLTLTTIDISAPGVPTSTIKYDSGTGSVRGNTTAWTNRTLWWGDFKATDTGGSGIARYEYSTGCTGALSGTLSSSHTYPNNTNYKFCIRAVDNAGNIGSWSGAFYINVDKSVPTCVTSGGGGWTAGNLSISGRCSGDSGGSGCSGAAPSKTFTSTTAGNYSPGNVTDNAGNATSCPSTGVYIDKTAPSVPSNNTNGYGGGWTRGTVTINSTANDAHSGINRIEYSYDKSTINYYSGSEILGPGNVSGKWTASRSNYVYMRAVDNMGNVSGWSGGIALNIDNTAPLSPKFSSFELSTGRITSNGCVGVGGTAANAACHIYVSVPRNAITIGHNFQTIDQHSGLSYEQYQWNHDGPWTKCTSWFTGNCGNWLAGSAGTFTWTMFSSRGIDNVGNAGYFLDITVHYSWY